MTNTNTKYTLKTLREVITNIFNASLETKRKPIKTQFDLIDNGSLGLRPGQLNILGARPGVGKTTFLVNVLNNIRETLSQGEVILFFSLEMSSEEIVQKLISINGGIPLSYFKTEEFQNQKAKLAKAIQELQNIQILFMEEPNLTVKTIKEIIEYLKSEGKLVKMIMVDHIQLMDDKTTNTKYEKVSKISRGLKMIAKENELIVFSLSQLSREYEKNNSLSKTKKRPTLSDLKDSGSLEQDADVVYLLSEETDVENGKILHMNVAKNRNGSTNIEGYLFFDTTIGKMYSTEYKKAIKESK